jgi:hypothetical protein
VRALGAKLGAKRIGCLDWAEHRPILDCGEAGGISGRLPGRQGLLVVHRGHHLQRGVPPVAVVVSAIAILLKAMCPRYEGKPSWRHAAVTVSVTGNRTVLRPQGRSGSCARWHPSGTSHEAMKKRWSPSRTSVTVMCITIQRRNRPYAE